MLMPLHSVHACFCLHGFVLDFFFDDFLFFWRDLRVILVLCIVCCSSFCEFIDFLHFREILVVVGFCSVSFSVFLGFPTILFSVLLQIWRGNFFRPNSSRHQTTEAPGHKPLVINVIVVGPFEEEEEGTGIASDVVKVWDEDLDTPGYLRGDRVRLGRRRSRIMGESPWARSR